MEEYKMTIQFLISLLLPYWGFISVTLGFIVYGIFQREQAKKIILSLMLRLEHEAENLALQTGDDKLEFMLEKGYQLLPSSVRLFVPQATFNGLAKSLYEKAKGYLIVHQGKVEPVAPLEIISIPTSDVVNVTPVVNIQDAVKQFTIEASQNAVNQVLVDITNAINNSVKPV